MSSGNPRSVEELQRLIEYHKMIVTQTASSDRRRRAKAQITRLEGALMTAFARERRRQPQIEALGSPTIDDREEDRPVALPIVSDGEEFEVVWNGVGPLPGRNGGASSGSSLATRSPLPRLHRRRGNA